MRTYFFSLKYILRKYKIWFLHLYISLDVCVFSYQILSGHSKFLREALMLNVTQASILPLISWDSMFTNEFKRIARKVNHYLLPVQYYPCVVYFSYLILNAARHSQSNACKTDVKKPFPNNHWNTFKNNKSQVIFVVSHFRCIALLNVYVISVFVIF